MLCMQKVPDLMPRKFPVKDFQVAAGGVKDLYLAVTFQDLRQGKECRPREAAGLTQSKEVYTFSINCVLANYCANHSSRNIYPCLNSQDISTPHPHPHQKTAHQYHYGQQSNLSNYLGS